MILVLSTHNSSQEELGNLNIYCEIKPYNNVPEDLSAYKAVILSGSPFSVRAEDAPHPDLSQIKGKKAFIRGMLWRTIFGTF